MNHIRVVHTQTQSMCDALTQNCALCCVLEGLLSTNVCKFGK